MRDRPMAARRERITRNHAVVIVALVALAVAASAWFWTTHQGAETDLGPSRTVIVVVSAGTFVTALFAAIRNVGLLEVLLLLCDVVAGLLSLVGAILRGLWAVICGLFGWD
jgi:hypothetical protein